MSFDLLPLEVKLHIFSYLDQSTLTYNTSMVSREFLEVSRHPVLWKKIRHHNKNRYQYVITKKFRKFLTQCTHLKEMQFENAYTTKSKAFFGKAPTTGTPIPPLSTSLQNLCFCNSTLHPELIVNLPTYFPNLKQLKLKRVSYPMSAATADSIRRGARIYGYGYGSNNHIEVAASSPPPQQLSQSLTHIVLVDLSKELILFLVKHVIRHCSQLNTVQIKYGYLFLPPNPEEYFKNSRDTLEHLRLSTIIMNNEQIVAICHHCPNLISFHCNCDTTICGETLQAISCLRNLKNLKMSRFHCSSETNLQKPVLRKFFANSSNLLKLGISNFSTFDDSILATIADSCSKLTKIKISHMANITDQGVKYFLGKWRERNPVPTPIPTTHTPTPTLYSSYLSSLCELPPGVKFLHCTQLSREYSTYIPPSYPDFHAREM